ncbi:aminodeoxychorismate synthase component I [Balneatrix alpica]|uniref:aminodeoxychorismate synthase component I n=1 Tax=Balneatrix alpica TaxID=75684 RepID=UPI0027395E6E|nr:aminodeoxychorismate synthase component I [Balneatrix alpica]
MALIEALPYRASVEVFPLLREGQYPVLLDSNAGEHQADHTRQGRYDILTADPLLRLVGDSNGCRLYDSEQRLMPCASDPFCAMQELLNEYPSCPEQHLPFTGGVIGYWGYDLGRLVETLPQQANADIHLPWMQANLYLWAVITDHQQQQSWLVSHPQCPPSLLHKWRQRLLQPTAPALPTASFQLNRAWQSNLSRADYGKRFRRIQEYIRSGDCYQVNLAQRFQAPYQGDTWQAYLRLRQAAPTPFAAYLPWQGGDVLSLSPERFLQVRELQVETKPIKGTRPRAQDPRIDQENAQALLHSPKDRAENLMIVDLLRNDLGRSCIIGSVKVPKLFAIESYPNVHHLVTTISGRLQRSQDRVPLLKGCFPGGSITGAPKVRAMEIIEELEPHRRSLYCGSIGYLSLNGQMDTNISIRTLIAHQQQLYCWAGGGIVADSDEEAEYQETLSKVGNLLQALRD